MKRFMLMLLVVMSLMMCSQVSAAMSKQDHIEARQRKWRLIWNKKQKQPLGVLTLPKPKKLARPKFGYKEIKFGMSASDIDKLGVCDWGLATGGGKNAWRTGLKSNTCYKIFGLKRWFTFSFAEKGRKNLVQLVIKFQLNSPVDITNEKINKVKKLLHRKYGLDYYTPEADNPFYFLVNSKQKLHFVYADGKVILREWMCKGGLRGNEFILPHPCIIITYSNSVIGKRLMKEIIKRNSVKSDDF